MGNNDNKNNNEIEETSSENNPFSQETQEEFQEDSSENLDVASDELTVLKNELEKVNNQYIRMAADFDNYRKRQMQEREALLKYGAEDTLKKLIEALDNIDRAMSAAGDSDDIETVRESYKMGFLQMYDVLKKIGLEVIETKDMDFDPNFHDAVMQTPTNEYPEHRIIAELQKGYKLGEKVLRPALVNVAASE